MSNLILTFTAVPTADHYIEVVVNTGVKDIPLRLTAKPIRTSQYQYQLAQGNTIADILETTFNFAFAWNLDYKNTGGTDNISAIALDDGGGNPTVTLSLANQFYTFVSATGTSIANGDVTTNIQNDPVPQINTIALVLAGNGDCSNVDYNLTIQGGTAPYVVSGLATANQTINAQTGVISVPRDVPRTITVTDALNAQIGQTILNPPDLLKAGNFTVGQNQAGGITATILNNVVIDSELLPIEYSLDGTTYNGTGIFTGLSFETQYTARIRDKFGCIVTKAFVTPAEITGGDGGTGTTSEDFIRYFEFSNAQTLTMVKLEARATNYTNSISFEEAVKLPYESEIIQHESWLVKGQFKSSYGFHKVVLKEGDSEFFIDAVEQSQNIGLQEKVDCYIFGAANDRIGIYFRNGNNYDPNTTVVNGTSPYNATNLPTWAKVGNTLVITGIGTGKVTRIPTDTVRGLYIELDFKYTGIDDITGVVQANYNIQDYNTYEFFFLASQINDCARVFIEAGFNDLVEVTYGSERIRKVSTYERYLDYKWSDPQNKAGIVFQTGIECRLLIPYNKWVASTESTTELDNSDDQAVSLYQETRDIATLSAFVYGFYMQRKLSQAAGMENFTINDINYKKREFTSKPLNSSNAYKVDAVFEFGGNNISVNVDELVLNPPATTVEKTPDLPTVLPNAIAIGDGGIILNSEGGAILIDDTGNS